MPKARLSMLFVGLCCLLLASGLEIIKLNDWKIQSSNATTSISGSDISKPAYDSSNWYSIKVPATVMDGLVQNEVYSSKTLYQGKNLDAIDDKQFDIPWWYRTQFQLYNASRKNDQRFVLTFKGINYKANLWINGIQIANSTSLIGTFRYFEFDITDYVTFTASNVIALDISKPNDYTFPNENNSTDLAISFIDWSPYSPDLNMGLWREVELTILDGPVSVRYPSVETNLPAIRKLDADIEFNSDEVDLIQKNDLSVQLTVLVDVKNYKNSSVMGVVRGSILGVCNFTQVINLNPLETRQVMFKSDKYPQLNVKNPNLWWPKQMGEPNLYNLTIEFMVSNGIVSDTLNQRFGMREMTSQLNERGHRVYFVNNKPILLRGGGWSPDLLLRQNATRLRIEFRYVLDMGLNSIRLEGKMENEDFYDLADEMGILALPGWACCDAWQHWPYWQSEQYFVANESLRSEVKRLRIHASNLVFMYSSDLLPPKDVEQLFLNVFQEERWPNPVLSSAQNVNSTITGPSGVKMSGPYSWVPPVYWTNDTDKHGGAFSFLTEGGPGENPMSYESLAKTLDESKIWPPNDHWDYHCGNENGAFKNLRYFNPSLNARYGESVSAKEYLYKSQASTYESHRAMFEAYSTNKYISTGLIQWMLNNPMPQMIWHLYDYHHNPNSAFYASKKSMEPIHPMYAYNDSSIWLVNSDYYPHSSISVSAEVYNLRSEKVYENTESVQSLGSDATMKLFNVPSDLANLTKTYFLRLTARNSTTNETITRNSYWLSTVPDVLDWSNTTFFTTFCTSFADFSDLQNLTMVNLTVDSTTRSATIDELSKLPLGQGVELKTQVTVTNPSNTIAMLVYVKLVKSTDNDIVLPILWDENYFSLLPGESQTVTATYNSDSLAGAKAQPEVQVWNNIVRPHATTCEM